MERLKAQREILEEQIHEARKPSKMLLELRETTSPDDHIGHANDLANQYDALFLTRDGNKAVIGYLTQRSISYDELSNLYLEKKNLVIQGITVDSSLGDQPAESLNFFVEDKKEPSVTISKVPIGDDPRFEIDGDIPDLGANLIILQVNLDDLNDPLTQRILDVSARYNTVAAYLPKQFAYNPDYGNFDKQEELDKLIRQTEEMIIGQVEKIKRVFDIPDEQRKAFIKDLIVTETEKIRRTDHKDRSAYVKNQLREFPFTQCENNPFVMAALQGIANRYSNTKFYYEDQSSKQ